MKIHLSNEPARTNLTDRECAKLLGGTIGALVQLSDIETVRRAVEWWAHTDEAWTLQQAAQQAARDWMNAKGYMTPKREAETQGRRG